MFLRHIKQKPHHIVFVSWLTIIICIQLLTLIQKGQLSGRLSLSEYKLNINYDDIQYIDFHNNERPNDTSKVVVLIKNSFDT